MLECLSSRFAINAIVPDELLDVPFSDCMQFLGLLLLLQAGGEDLVDERSFGLEVSDVSFVVVFSDCSLRKGQLPINWLSEQLFDAALSAVEDDTSLALGSKIVLCDLDDLPLEPVLGVGVDEGRGGNRLSAELEVLEDVVQILSIDLESGKRVGYFEPCICQIRPDEC